jgi:L-lactate dehydrogenase (cytochrome)
MSLDRCHNIDDLRALARKRLPKFIFDYIDGGADDEVTLCENRSRFSAYKLLWDALVDVSAIETQTTVMGDSLSAPLIISPTASTRLFHPRAGERAVAAPAGKAGLAYGFSTLGTTPVEEIAALTQGPKWFQVYVWKDRALVEQILDRVKAAGFTALILTVDLPVHGNRERDLENDFAIPPRVTPRNALQALARPGYLWDLATTPAIEPANFPPVERHGSFASFIGELLDSSVTWEYARWLKETWGGPMAIKGIIHEQNAQRAIDLGADAVWISNHGGRQLDTSPATIDRLAHIVDAVGSKADVILDGGIRRGTDIVKAIALGAKAVAIGRPYLYGLAAGGEAGVAKAIHILLSELERDMALLGCPRIADIQPRHVLPPT